MSGAKCNAMKPTNHYEELIYGVPTPLKGEEQYISKAFVQL